MRTAIGPAPFYSVGLRVDGDAPGLLEGAHDTALHVKTRATSRLMTLLSDSSSGRFALCGPIGVGKTSLLAALCAGRYSESDKRDLTVRVPAPIRYDTFEYVRHVYTRTCEAVIEYANSPAYSARRWLRVRPFVDARVILSRLFYYPPSLDKLAAIGQAKLDALRTVRKITDEQGAEVQLKVGPLGGRRSARRSISSEMMPMTLPQLSDDFREFLRIVSDELGGLGSAIKVIIVIDALDEINRPEHARDFVADLKSFMEVHGCYFMVAISRQASIRFDASEAGFKGLDEASRMLRERVVGLSEQFVALAYCLAGALPLKLIRVARDIRRPRPAETGPSHSLGTVAATLVLAELKQRCGECRDALRAQTGRLRAVSAALPHVAACLRA